MSIFQNDFDGLVIGVNSFCTIFYNYDFVKLSREKNGVYMYSVFFVSNGNTIRK